MWQNQICEICVNQLICDLGGFQTRSQKLEAIKGLL